MLTLYHLATSRSDRIIWLLEELGLPYAIERLDREPNLAAPERLKQVHPLGKAPTIRDGDVVLTESGAIVDYITRRLGGGRLSVAPEAPGFADYLFWLHFAEGSFASQLLREWYIDLMAPDGDDDPRVTRVRQNGRAMMALVEQRLAAVPFFAGDALTGADIMMSFPFTTMQTFVALDLADRPNIAAYVERIRQRPAWRRAMAVAEGRAPG
jgi:glutathione S-transferase